MSSFNSVSQPPSGGKLSSSQDELQKNIMKHLASTSALANAAKSALINGETAAEIFKLCNNDYGQLDYNILRIERTIKLGLTPSRLTQIATDERGTFDHKSYALLLFISDNEMRIPEYMHMYGITGSKIVEMLGSKFDGNPHNMHSALAGIIEGSGTVTVHPVISLRQLPDTKEGGIPPRTES